MMLPSRRIDFGRDPAERRCIGCVAGAHSPGNPARRAGVATLDYVLVLGIILPLAAFVIPAGKHILELVYEMICTLIAWPFM